MRRKLERRLTDRKGACWSFIGAGAVMAGNLKSDGDLIVSGSVKGEVKARGAFTLRSGGRWEGNVEAASAVLAGEVQGNVSVTEKLEIHKSARIRGSLRAHAIAVADGATIEGNITVTSSAPITRFEEKRKEGR